MASAPRRRVRARWLSAVVAALAVVLAAFAVTTATSIAAEASSPPGTAPVVTSPVDEEVAPSVGAAGAALANNEFMPERENVSECFSSMERPNCGSSAKGGWRQTLVFVFIAGAMVVIASRLVVAIRRRDRALDAS